MDTCYQDYFSAHYGVAPGSIAPDHVVVVWQALHSSVVGIWSAGFPSAITPLWHELQAPMTDIWSTLVTGSKVMVLWQSSHVSELSMCDGDLPMATVLL